MNNLGFSTGCLYKTGLGMQEQLELIAKTGCTAVELNFLSTSDLVAIRGADVCRNELEPFSYVSMHAPVHPYARNEDTFDIFAAIRKIHRIRSLDLVVVHPDTVQDFSVFENLAFPVAFENMDKRKTMGQVPPDLLKILYQSKYTMVLDVNHAFTIHRNEWLAYDFWEILRPWIKQIHLSGYAPPDHLHWPLFKTRQAEIIRSIQDPTIPIIVESVLAPDELIRERDYILEILAN